VLCYALINDLTHDVLQRDNKMIWKLERKKEIKTLWISPEVIAKDIIYKP
jgi:hypothetical protein